MGFETTQERVMRSVAPRAEGSRLDRFVAEAFGQISRGAARKAIGDGRIWINGECSRIQSRTLYKGDRVTWLELPDDDEASELEAGEEREGLIDWRVYGGRPEFLERDKYFAVINKPSGVPIEPTPKEDLRTCQRQIEAVLREEGLMAKRIYVAAVHRLDAGASGAVAFALRKRAAQELSAQFASRTAGRVYLALADGLLEDDEATLDFPIGRVGPGVRQGVVGGKRGKQAITHLEVLQRFERTTLVQLRLQTGRTHQIRVHLAHIGHPLIGDWLYGPKGDDAPQAPRMMLHAQSLSITHPVDGRAMTFEAPLDEAFTQTLDALSEGSA